MAKLTVNLQQSFTKRVCAQCGICIDGLGMCGNQCPLFDELDRPADKVFKAVYRLAEVRTLDGEIVSGAVNETPAEAPAGGKA
jgi:hypothetical protein